MALLGASGYMRKHTSALSTEAQPTNMASLLDLDIDIRLLPAITTKLLPVEQNQL